MFKFKRQLNKLYAMCAIGNFSLGGASWVALLAARGFSLLEIGFLETIFHITSLTFEIPSGMLADLYGRKKMMIASHCMAVISAVIMIVSGDFREVAVSICFSALSYNFASGSGEAYAYDGMKRYGMEEAYEHFTSMKMILYRIFNGAALLCAGFALIIGYKAANTADALLNLVCIAIALSLEKEPMVKKGEKRTLSAEVKRCFSESFRLLAGNREVQKIMVCNSLVGALAILLGFFLQARLPQTGLPDVLLGPVLFVMGLGGIVGARMVLLLKSWNYRKVAMLCLVTVIFGVAAERTGICVLLCIGGFLASFSDDVIQIRSDALLNEMIPSEQRATLISVSSFCFSVVMIVLSPIAGWFFGG
ncbi:MAG: MFS transporter [Lachnospiraceae bacterium]|nr:MFS transporter [Lachnospiraceae bacterium]